MISKAEAREIAKEVCKEKGFPWVEPVYVKWGLFSYFVWGGGRKGGNLTMRIRKKDGAVLSAGMTPR